MGRARRRLGAVLAGVLLAVLTVTWAGGPAYGHALLAASTPADGASLDQAPTEALLAFTEAPDPALAVVHVLDASGKQVEAGKVQPVAGQPTQLRIPMRSLERGTYTITWRITSSGDGHTTAGSVAFGVGVPAPGGSAEAVRSPPPTPVGIAGRWLFYVGVVLLLGAAVVGAAVVADPATISRPALGAAWGAAAAGLVLTIADQRANSETSLANLLSSATGHKLTTEAVALLLAGAAVAWACLRHSRAALAAVGAGASAAMLARALAGHAGESSARWFTVGVQWIHLVSVGAWIGGLVWLLVALRRGDRGQGPGLARRFSTLAGVTLGVVAVSGVVRAVAEVGAWTRLLHTDFGVALLVKVGLFTALVALGARSRFRHVPGAAADGGGRLRRLVRWEVGLGVAVMGATAVLAGLPPSVLVAEASKSRPVPAADLTVTGNDDTTSVRVQLVVSPGLPGPNAFDATVADYGSGRPLAAQTVVLQFKLKDQADAGAATLDLTRAPDAHWRGLGRALSIGGRWSVTALVQTATGSFEVPMDLETRRPPTEESAAPGSSGAGSSCGSGQPDPAYTVATETDPNPPRAEGAIVRMTVRHEGRAVTGAKVCIVTDMPDMQHAALSKVAKEVSGGRYDAEIKFGMGGSWSATVTIAEPGRPAVTVSAKFQVQEPG